MRNLNRNGDWGLVAMVIFFFAWFLFVYLTSQYFGWDAHMVAQH